MNLPPQLSLELDQLRSQGLTIEVQEDGSLFCLIFKGYTLPKGVWNKTNTDLLVIAHPVYPNAKLDMFWVEPGLSLADGRTPHAGDVMENHCSKPWQRFSWHPSAWNPAHDNIITYLEFVNHRLNTRE